MTKRLLFLLTVLFAGTLATTAGAQTDSNQGNYTRSDNSTKTENMDNVGKEAQSFTEYQAVVNALQPYIESARTGDGELSRSAFYDHAHIVGSIDGTFSNVDADQFGESVGSLGPSENIQHHIAWIDVSGPAAAAKVEFIDWHGFRFTDLFILYKNDGVWKISGKVYNTHSRN